MCFSQSAPEKTQAVSAISPDATFYISLLDLHSRREFAQLVQKVEAMEIHEPPTATELQSIYLATDALYELEEYQKSQQFAQFWLANVTSSDSEQIKKLQPYVLYQTALCIDKLGDTKSAQRTLEQIIALEIPGELASSIYVQLAWMAQYQSDLSNSKMYLAKAMENTRPNSAAFLSGRLLQAVHAKQSREIMSAIETLNEVRAVCASKPSLAELHFKADVLLLQAYVEESQASNAESLIEELGKLDAPSPYLEDFAQLEAGLALLQLKKNAEAIAILCEIANQSAHPSLQQSALLALLRLPDAFNSVDKRAEWVQKLASMPTLKPESKAEANLRYARQLATTVDWEKSLSLLQATITQQDISEDWKTSAKIILAEVYYHHELFTEAEDVFTKLIDAETLDRSTESFCLAHLRLGEIAALQNNWNLVRTHLDQIDQLQDHFAYLAPIYYLKARVALAAGNFNDCRKLANQAVETAALVESEVAARAQWMIGETYFLQKQYVQAISEYDQVQKFARYPQWCSLAFLQSGKCHELLGQWSQAAAAYQNLCDQFSDSIYFEEAKQRLATAKSMSADGVNVAEKPTSPISSR